MSAMDQGHDELDVGALSDQLVHEIQRRILVGEVPVGSWLRHGALAEEFGVSRTPVREALRVLGAQGVVTIVRNRGARVNGHSARDIRELGAIRAELEGLAAALAAEHISDAQLRRLRSAWEGYSEAISEFVDRPEGASGSEEAERWVAANEEFHGVILEASGNRQLAINIAEIHRRLPRNISFSVYADNSRLLLANVAEHEAIAQAISDHDPEAARRAMGDHLRSSSELLARWHENHLAAPVA